MLLPMCYHRDVPKFGRLIAALILGVTLANVVPVAARTLVTPRLTANAPGGTFTIVTPRLSGTAPRGAITVVTPRMTAREPPATPTPCDLLHPCSTPRKL